ncbi:mate-domain-containing protein [Hyaloraphidium curvatum]|nr:mate-domain-containing protein [Hyaloraphidium curvatum]
MAADQYRPSPTDDDCSLVESPSAGEPSEFAPLLGPGADSRGVGACRALLRLAGFAAPISAGYSLAYVSQLTTTFFVGHLGGAPLAAACLALAFANATSFGVLVGLAAPMDVLCAQAFAGAPDPEAVGEVLQLALAVAAVAIVPMAALWWSAGPLLALLGQDPEVVQLAASFLRALLPALPGFAAFECVKRFLQAQGIASAYTAVVAATTAAGVPLTYLLVRSSYGLGFLGAPVAIAAMNWGNLALMLLYIRFFDGARGWGGFSWKALRLDALRTYLKLAAPAVLQVAAEWWTFEVLAVMAGLLGSAQLAAQSVLATATSFVFMFPLGTGVAATTLVGQAIGAGRPREAELLAKSGLALGFLIGLAILLLFLVVRNHLGPAFTDDPAVTDRVALALPIAAVYSLADAVNTVAAGVLRGIAQPAHAAFASFVGCYLVGLPLGAYLAFGRPEHRLRGLWIGVASGAALSAVWGLFFVFNASFDEEVMKARARLGTRVPSECEGEAAERRAVPVLVPRPQAPRLPRVHSGSLSSFTYGRSPIAPPALVLLHGDLGLVRADALGVP